LYGKKKEMETTYGDREEVTPNLALKDRTRRKKLF